MKHWHTNRKIGLASVKALGNTNTDGGVSADLCREVLRELDIRPGDKILEPAVGAGAFYFGMLAALTELGFTAEEVIADMLVGMDVDAAALDILRTRIRSDFGDAVLATADIRHADFLTADFGEERFRVVITNPPYVAAKNIAPAFGLSREDWTAAASMHLAAPAASRSDLYAYFLLRALPLIPEDGLCAFLCSDSWVDADFGAPIRDLVSGNGYALRTVMNAQMTPFFRDDTNAIFFTIGRTGGDDSLVRVHNFREPGRVIPETSAPAEISLSGLREIFTDPDLRNRRNALFLFGPEHAEVSGWFSARADVFAPLGTRIGVETSSVQASRLRDWPQADTGAADAVPVFWQKQARVNAPPNYKTRVAAGEMPVRVRREDLVRAGLAPFIRRDRVFLSTIIDRFPLVFSAPWEAVHVSKYLALRPEGEGPDAVATRIQSVYAILAMETFLKEGTRKTLRRGECGLAKEVSAGDLRAVPVLACRLRPETLEVAARYQHRVLYNIEDALLDEDYWETQRALTADAGLTEADLRWATRMATFLYVLRMRSEVKLPDFAAWYRDTHEARLFPG